MCLTAVSNRESNTGHRLGSRKDPAIYSKTIIRYTFLATKSQCSFKTPSSFETREDHIKKKHHLIMVHVLFTRCEGSILLRNIENFFHFYKPQV